MLFLVTGIVLVKVSNKYKGIGKFDIPYLMSDSMFWTSQQMYYSVRSSSGQALAVIQESIFREKKAWVWCWRVKHSKLVQAWNFYSNLAKQVENMFTGEPQKIEEYFK